MIRVRDLEAWYGHTQALFGVDLDVADGDCLALVGPNGAGKTTTLRAILGLIRSEGIVEFDGTDLGGTPTSERVVRHRIAVVHEGRGLFPDMTVRENLIVGTDSGWKLDLEPALRLLPQLETRLDARASDLSGGEQQMVAIGRALLRRPTHLLLDEPSLGLAPIIIDEVYEHLQEIRQDGLTVILVEQSVERALSIADRLMLVKGGQSVMTAGSRDHAAVERLVAMAFDDVSTVGSDGPDTEERGGHQ